MTAKRWGVAICNTCGQRDRTYDCGCGHSHCAACDPGPCPGDMTDPVNAQKLQRAQAAISGQAVVVRPKGCAVILVMRLCIMVLTVILTVRPI